ncbi:hypothetical protein AOQ84DRAFT_103410 [Glonium stellatum]|uniref:Uncharacterized protein n=1 Tax=Glonium stellatum TaxID=574774 RepID=A0A8E2EUE9_9PEZI|nr:hypothetical protein AOQ84DRAFT_103410 [Glonium stellatum]
MTLFSDAVACLLLLFVACWCLLVLAGACYCLLLLATTTATATATAAAAATATVTILLLLLATYTSCHSLPLAAAHCLLASPTRRQLSSPPLLTCSLLSVTRVSPLLPLSLLLVFSIASCVQRVTGSPG